jgi:CBS domain containing-hemolysin-like protein
VLLVFILAVGSALLVSTTCSLFEAVLLSLSPSQVEMMMETHPLQAENLKKLKGNIEQPITAILTLATAAHTIGATVAGAMAVALFGQNGLIWFSLVFTLAILLVTEIVPKTIGVTFAKQLGPYIVFPLRIMITVLKPLIWMAQLMTRLVPNS